MPIEFQEGAQRVPVRLWTPREKVDRTAIDQLRNTASLPFVFKHIAAMPDVHTGIGASVGSVVATQGAVMPAAVGVDIGCGMMAVRTTLSSERVREKIQRLRKTIESTIPVGIEGNRKLSPSVEKWPGWAKWDALNATKHHRRAERELWHKARHQLGSLGGGNHFIEICLDTEDAVWVMLHSGSRNIGKSIAEIHIHRAKGLMKEMQVALPDPNLAYFVEKTPEFTNYLSDLDWAQAFALENREEMMRRVLAGIHKTLKLDLPLAKLTDRRINCHHNYASREHHYGENVWVTRKGAVRAGAGELGIIPGSMGARSFIVEGLGNAASFHSCSHGAGRRMSRSEARRRFTVQDLANQTAGIECRKDRGVLDEIPGAYKDIDDVMRNQQDLVKIVAELKQIACIKG